MSQGTKIFLGILTFLPFLLLIGLVSMVFGLVSGVVGDVSMHGQPDADLLASNVFPIILLGSAAGLLSMAVVIYYIVHVLSSKKVDNTVQVLWVLILLFTSPIGSIVYWYMNIWNDPPARDTPPVVNSGYSN